MLVFSFEHIASVKEQFATFWTATEVSISSQKTHKKRKRVAVFLFICTISGDI